MVRNPVLTSALFVAKSSTVSVRKEWEPRHHLRRSWLKGDLQRSTAQSLEFR